MDVGLDRSHRALDDERDADGRGQVVDGVRLVDQLGDHAGVGRRVDGVVEVGPPLRWRMLSMLPVDRSSSTWIAFPACKSESLRWEPTNPAPPVIKYFNSYHTSILHRVTAMCLQA